MGERDRLEVRFERSSGESGANLIFGANAIEAVGRLLRVGQPQSAASGGRGRGFKSSHSDQHLAPIRKSTSRKTTRKSARPGPFAQI
jgi:hypothetical protein